MGFFRRKNSRSSTSPYACEAAIESTSSFGSISHTPAMSRAHLPLIEEPSSAVSSLSSGSYAAHSPTLGMPQPAGRHRPRLHPSASTHNLYTTAAPPLPSLPAHYHSQSLSFGHGYYTPTSSPMSPPTPHYLPARSTPNLLQPRPSNSAANTNRLGGNKEASASRVSLASAGRSLARVPTLWKRKFRRSQNSTNSDASDSSREPKRR
ncbi:hypothetical protein CcaverHIS002_0102150 [Cutaneotrichosporon cavernicola]|uniref:Uncharacterized protein n=1 Tax=Cutaneotrichosporon cavernicola TaxID=279322 RepID=A0AA48I145_9TREE|nr:uncharacterized protein CcaverHIS019_0102100 [Cutaneotrichosporon cavernicola]BEI79686.1 hypothetical protein CcaverHIS002_0102150 [Cutaneotrichosporon cavernicola]BEI87492.1 hypothetical protein CcaverHIS019_0102100 [Cutaneotrichosporon cavernicola]BEI95263.1 hypothetical protein CcaverHIS631_0102120 [Cutaneotrichosporon cavernicola]BEJ03036.1 hypothetical protein CcaverHIS641_0102110 [Cutaneotrichosporon cavernicola]